MLYLIIIIIALIIIYVLWQYNSFIKLNNMVKEAFSTMDVYLKKRWDLIPNLVEVVKGYTKYESSVLEEITNIRTEAYNNMQVNEKIQKNELLTDSLSKIIGISENYPDLKANEQFLNLSRDITKVEDEIANSRKYYNAVVKNFNTKIQAFPSNIIASIFGYKEAKMFEIEKDERKNIKIGE